MCFMCESPPDPNRRPGTFHEFWVWIRSDFRNESTGVKTGLVLSRRLPPSTLATWPSGRLATSPLGARPHRATQERVKALSAENDLSQSATIVVWSAGSFPVH